MTIGLPILRDDAPQVGRTPPAAPDTARRPGRLVDSHGRTIRDLRLSVTELYADVRNEDSPRAVVAIQATLI